MFFIFNYIFILLPTSLKGNLRSVLSSQAFYSVHSVTINVHCTCVIPTSQILLLSLLFTHWEKCYAFMVFYQIRFFFMNCKELDYRFEIDANIDSSPLVL